MMKSESSTSTRGKGDETPEGGAASTASFVEDPDSLEGRIVELALSGQLAGAAREAIKLQERKGIPVTFERDGKVIKRHPDGREEVLAIIKSAPYTIPPGVKISGGT